MSTKDRELIAGQGDVKYWLSQETSEEMSLNQKWKKAVEERRTVGAHRPFDAQKKRAVTRRPPLQGSTTYAGGSSTV